MAFRPLAAPPAYGPLAWTAAPLERWVTPAAAGGGPGPRGGGWLLCNGFQCQLKPSLPQSKQPVPQQGASRVHQAVELACCLQGYLVESRPALHFTKDILGYLRACPAMSCKRQHTAQVFKGCSAWHCFPAQDPVQESFGNDQQPGPRLPDLQIELRLSECLHLGDSLLGRSRGCCGYHTALRLLRPAPNYRSRSPEA